MPEHTREIDEELNAEALRDLKSLGIEPPPPERAQEVGALVRKAIQTGVCGTARWRPQNDNE